jgi:predicted XRE-type DNA-binding protein
MTKQEPLDVTSGSGNVFADLGYANPQVHQAKAVLAAEIIKALDAGGLTVRKAEAQTGIAAADFSRIRNADLARFTIDRLIRVLDRLDTGAAVQVTIRPGAQPIVPFPARP